MCGQPIKGAFFNNVYICTMNNSLANIYLSIDRLPNQPYLKWQMFPISNQNDTGHIVLL